MTDDAIALRFDGPVPGCTVQVEASEAWVKAGPRMLENLADAPLGDLDLGIGLRRSLPRRLERFCGVNLVWSHFFIAGERCFAIYDDDARQAVAGIVDWPGLAAVAGIRRQDSEFVVSRARLRDAERITGPVLFASSDEPHNWGMWLLYVLPAVLHFIANRSSYQRLFIYAAHENMRDMLRFLGVSSSDMILHDCSQAYYFEDVHVFRQPCREFYVSTAMRGAYARLAGRAASNSSIGERLYVGRLRRTREQGAYRGLLNEEELIDGLRPLGFCAIDPEYLGAEEQLALFARASQIVALGGAGLFNAVFSKPESRLISIDSTRYHLPNHSTMLASVGLDYGFIVGQEDPADPAAYNKRWSIDTARAVDAVRAFMECGR